MEIVLSMILIFLFLALIYNHFFKIIEGMKTCSLDSDFQKKQPSEVNQMSSKDRELYKCQERLYEKEQFSPEEIERNMADTKQKLSKYKSTLIKSKNRYKNKIMSLYNKYSKEKKQRKVMITKLIDFVGGGDGGEDSEEEEDVDTCEKDKRACGDPTEGPEPKHRKNQSKIQNKIKNEAEE